MNDIKPEEGGGFLAGRLRSFGYALRGFVLLLSTQQNARIHLVATVAVVTLGAVFRVASGEWISLVFAMSGVWVAEGLNTAIEALADRVTTERDPLIARAKDVAAGAVLIAAVGAAVVGGIIFLPRIVAIFER
jgi:diacylglycerol kinase